jgi:hypothetical protein
VLRRLTWLAGILLVGCAVAETVLAVKRVYTNEDWAPAVAWLSILVAMVACLSLRAGRAACLVGPAAASFTVASQYVLDPYFFPDTQRYAEETAMWPYFLLAAVACVVAAVTYRAPRFGGVLTGLLLPVLAIGSFASGLH